MPYVDVRAVSGRLLADDRIADRLAADYGLTGDWRNPDTLPKALNAAFGQQVVKDPLGVTRSNADVFRAAARALASNNRSWSTFLKSEERFEACLREYDPEAVVRALESGEPVETEIQTCLPGQTSKADARAIAAWACLLLSTPDYYALLTRVGSAVASRGVLYREIMPCVAVLLGNPPSDMRWARLFPDLKRPATLKSWKLPGMGAVLASEFLRNLGWSGFKPDRHIKRLFRQWFPEVVAGCGPRAEVLAQVCGRRAQADIDFMVFALVGVAVTPLGAACSEVDNVVWALGAYVEKKHPGRRRSLGRV